MSDVRRPILNDMLKILHRAWLSLRFPRFRYTVVKDYEMAVFQPNPLLRYKFFASNNDQVGSCECSLDSTNSRLFIRNIDVPRDLRNRGYGTTIVIQIGKTHGVPIVPYNDRAPGFWAKMRALNGVFFTVDPSEG